MTPSIIELKNVSKIFDEKEALKSINLDIKEKEFVAESQESKMLELNGENCIINCNR